MAKRVYEAVATIGEYTDRNGQTKKRYLTVGNVFESDKGGLSLKLDSVPLGQDWSGWINFYVPKERELTQEQQEHTEAKGNAFQPQGGDIPF